MSAVPGKYEMMQSPTPTYFEFHRHRLAVELADEAADGGDASHTAGEQPQGDGERREGGRLAGPLVKLAAQQPRVVGTGGTD